MRYIDILEAFETEINEINNAVSKPSTDDSLYFLNQAVTKFVKQRFNGDFIHKTSYEQNEKRRNDLINLFKEIIYNADELKLSDINPLYNQYECVYPENFLYALSENAIISDNNGYNIKDTSVFECTSNNFMYRITNSLTDFHYKYGEARPIRIRTVSGCKLFTDKNYIVQTYTLGYLKQPNKITLDNPFVEYTDFDDTTMPEIIKIAAQMYLENTSNQRYKTITQEVSTQE